MTVCQAIVGNGDSDAVWFLEDVGFGKCMHACLI